MENEQQEGCKAKYEGEPTFTLVGRDRTAVIAIGTWIEQATVAGVNREKIEDAKTKLIRFVQWQSENPDKVKVPD